MNTFFRFLAAFFLLFAPFQLLANDQTNLLKAYAQLPQVSFMAVSPDASKIAFRVKDEKNDVLMVRNAADLSYVSSIKLGDISPLNLYFVNDDTVVFIGTKNIRLKGFKGRHDGVWAYAFNIHDKSSFKLLEEGNGIYPGQSKLGHIVGISPDRRSLYMPAWSSEVSYSLYRIPLDDRKKPVRIIRGTEDTRDYFFNASGELIARERVNNDKNLHIIEARVDEDWVEIFREQTEIPTKSFNGVTPDQQYLMFSSYDRRLARKAYFKMSLKDGAVQGPVFSRDDKDAGWLIKDINRTVHGVAYHGFTPSYEFFDEKLNARMRAMAKALPNNFVSIRNYTPDWSGIMFYVDGQTSSGDFFLYNKGKLNFISAMRPGFPRQIVNPVIEYEYKTRDDYTIPTLLTVPKGKELKDLPAIVMPHGGPESYDDKAFDYKAQFFAKQGYLVIQPQFRGSDGFGWQHLALGRGEWGKKMQDDLTDAVSALVKEGRVNKDKVCIVGASYGGYAALAGATFTPDVYKCAVSINGVSDVEAIIADRKRRFGSDHWVVSYWKELLEKGEVAENHLDNISPVNHVDKVQIPVLLIHGTRDKVVPFEQSETFYDEMEDADKDVKLVELEYGGHYLSDEQHRITTLQATYEFIKKHI